jgi:hypothetical protein
MSLACLFGAHRPSLSSIMKRPFGLCDGCGRPMMRVGNGKWALTDPLDTPVKS